MEKISINDDLFCKKSINKLLLKFAIPAIISLLVSELYNMVDTVFVGRVIGGTGIGALTVAFPIQRLIISIGMMISIGAYTAVARGLGERNYKEIKLIIANSLSITIVIMLALTSIIFIFKDGIIRGLGASHNIFPYARDYISIVVFGGIFQCLTVVVCYIMTGLGNTNITLKATSIGAILNIIVDYILIVQLSMGVKGAAIATVASQIISFIYACYRFKKVKKNFNLALEFNFNKDTIITIMAIGFSTFVVECSDAVVLFILNNILVIQGGEEALIIFGVITKVSMLLFITVIGVSSAMQPIAAFNYGRENYEKVKETIAKTIKLDIILTTFLWLITFIFAKDIIAFFIKDKALIVETAKTFRIVISIFPSVVIYYVAIYYYQAMGEAKTSFILSIYRQILIFIPVLLVMMQFWGFIGICLAYPISDAISSVTGIIYINRAVEGEEGLQFKIDNV